MPKCTEIVRFTDMPISSTSLVLVRRKSYSSFESSGLRRCISMNFLGSHTPIIMMRRTLKPSAPMLDTFCATYTFMPSITDMTAISVVVARIIPSSVRKLRSLLPRRESAAPLIASPKEALVLIQYPDEIWGWFVPCALIHSIMA